DPTRRGLDVDIVALSLVLRVHGHSLELGLNPVGSRVILPLALAVEPVEGRVFLAPLVHAVDEPRGAAKKRPGDGPQTAEKRASQRAGRSAIEDVAPDADAIFRIGIAIPHVRSPFAARALGSDSPLPWVEVVAARL